MSRKYTRRFGRETESGYNPSMSYEGGLSAEREAMAAWEMQQLRKDAAARPDKPVLVRREVRPAPAAPIRMAADDAVVAELSREQKIFNMATDDALTEAYHLAGEAGEGEMRLQILTELMNRGVMG